MWYTSFGDSGLCQNTHSYTRDSKLVTFREKESVNYLDTTNRASH